MRGPGAPVAAAGRHYVNTPHPSFGRQAAIVACNSSQRAGAAEDNGPMNKERDLLPWILGRPVRQPRLPSPSPRCRPPRLHRPRRRRWSRRSQRRHPLRTPPHRRLRPQMPSLPRRHRNSIRRPSSPRCRRKSPQSLRRQVVKFGNARQRASRPSPTIPAATNPRFWRSAPSTR